MKKSAIFAQTGRVRCGSSLSEPQHRILHVCLLKVDRRWLIFENSQVLHLHFRADIDQDSDRYLYGAGLPELQESAFDLTAFEEGGNKMLSEFLSLSREFSAQVYTVCVPL